MISSDLHFDTVDFLPLFMASSYSWLLEPKSLNGKRATAFYFSYPLTVEISNSFWRRQVTVLFFYDELCEELTWSGRCDRG
jgi:hypothetical protein